MHINEIQGQSNVCLYTIEYLCCSLPLSTMTFMSLLSVLSVVSLHHHHHHHQFAKMHIESMCIPNWSTSF